MLLIRMYLCEHRPIVEEDCKHHCPKQLKDLEECTQRVQKLLAEAKPGEEV
jgi:hypothetical protein